MMLFVSITQYSLFSTTKSEATVMSRFFSKFIVSAFVVLGIATASYAQDEANMARPLTKSGSAAFMFNLGGIGTFGLSAEAIATAIIPNVLSPTGSPFSTPVVGAGMKYFIGDDMAVKVLLAFGSTSNGDTATKKNTTMQFGIGAIYEYHFRPLYSTSPYIGGGIRFGTASQTFASGTSSEVKASGTTFGIGVVAGFDWFFTKGLALGAEYGLGFSSASGSITVPSPGIAPTVPTSTAIGIGLNGSGSLHALVYF